MANKKIDMLQLKQLLRLYTQGVSKLQISSQLGLSRNTVKKYAPEQVHLVRSNYSSTLSRISFL